MHSLSFDDPKYLKYIMSGEKKFEGRICTEKRANMRVGDPLMLINKESCQQELGNILCEITSIDKYISFEQMLLDKGVENMLPDLRGTAPDKLLARGIEIYRSFPHAQDEEKFGVMAIGVKLINN